MISEKISQRTNGVKLVPYFWPKLRNCVLSLSVRVHNKICSQCQKNSIPKTLYLCHHPSTRTTCMSELKNVLACNGDGHGDGHGHGNGNGNGDGSGDGNGNGDGDSNGDGGGKGNGNMRCH